MRATFALALASVVALASAQSLPDCASTCINPAAPVAGCTTGDVKCYCGNQAFVSSTSACIQKNCTGSDIQAAITYAQTVCTAVGATLSLPSSTGSATGSATATGSSASATVTSPVSASGSSTIVTTGSGSASHSGSATGSGSAAPSGSVSGSGSVTGSGSGSAAAPSTTTGSSGASANAISGVVALVAAGLAAVAL